MQKDSWKPDLYKKSAAFVSQMALDLVDLLEPKESERVLDLGCGDGTLALEISKRGSIVEAVDLSANMVKAAKKRGVNAKVMSATNLAFNNNRFDAIFSNAVLHWVLEPKVAIKNINKALKSGGRFVAEFGGKGNVEKIVEAIREVFNRHIEFGEFRDIWYFPSANEYKELLEEQSFRVEFIKLIPRPTPIDDISNWLELFTNGFTVNLTIEQKEIFKKEVKELLKESLYSKKDGWVADYVRLRVKAIKS
jgi:2-isopropylmalate synthase